ncbi:MAG TPA: hypothetical protein VJZ26_14825 [Blastocatellia bacterium]|nr:hypothetical protein [Blastocatellia bacterium]
MSRRTISAILLMAFLFIGAMAQSPSPKISEQPATLDERLGADDGAALAILISANLRGNLNLCDCNHPRGGLARRIGYLEAFKKKFKETALLQVESGAFWYNTMAQDRVTMLQNDLVTAAYSRWPMDVINLGRFDLPYAQKLFGREGFAERARRWPMIKNIISANGIFDGKEGAPPPYIIKQVTGPRIKGKKNTLRVGFIGLAEPLATSGGMMDATVTNMFETARRVTLRARKECDLLVIVAHSELEGAMRLARENPEADVVIAGNAEAVFKPRQVANTLVVSAAPGNTQQGDLRVYFDKDGRASFKYISTDLDAAVPADPDAAAFVQTANQELERARFNH